MKIIALDTSKKCSICKEIKAAIEFYKNSECKTDGLQTQCKLCIAKRKKVYYQANKKRIDQASIAYRQANSEKVKQCKKAYYLANLEKYRQYNKDYYQHNRAKGVKLDWSLRSNL